MSRNLLSDKCPRCRKQHSIGSTYGLPLLRITDFDPSRGVEALGCKLTCECGIDLFVWIRADMTESSQFGMETPPVTVVHPPAGQIDLSYYHTFNQQCLPGLRFKEINPRPAGIFFCAPGSAHEEVRGKLAWREGRWRSFLDSKAAYSETGGEPPTWEFDEYEFPIYWSATKDAYFRDISCLDFSTCDACHAAGGPPYDLGDAVTRDRIRYYTGITARKYRITQLIWFLGQDYTWHYGKIVNNHWSHEGQVWLYVVVDLGQDYSGRKLTKREDELYQGKPAWAPIVVNGETHGESGRGEEMPTEQPG